jgi:hypothetical protein
MRSKPRSNAIAELLAPLPELWKGFWGRVVQGSGVSLK